MDREPEIWWKLPGPRRFVARVIGDLEDGRNCILRIPETMSLDAMRGVFRKEFAGRDTLVWEHRTARELIDRSREPVRALAKIYGIAEASGPPLGPRDIALAPVFSGFLIWLDGWDEVEESHRHAWFNFLQQYACAAKQRELIQRSVICLAVSGKAALEPSSSGEVLLADHWWWSVASRLDMAVLIEELRRDSGYGDDLLDTMLARAAGYDPRLAAWLVSEGCADALALERKLNEYADCFKMALSTEEVAFANAFAAMAYPSIERTIPSALATLWARGQVNHLRRDGVHWHLAALAGAGVVEGIARELWSAQAGVVLPRIDQQRALICRYLEARHGNGWRRCHAGDAAPAEGEIIQIGQLKFLFDTDVKLRREPDELRGLVRWLHYARNELSHLRALSTQDLERGKIAVGRAALILSGTPEG